MVQKSEIHASSTSASSGYFDNPKQEFLIVCDIDPWEDLLSWLLQGHNITTGQEKTFNFTNIYNDANITKSNGWT
jgi:hypothetical protein